MIPLADDILTFWFGPLPHEARAEWFRKDPAFDATIRVRFGDAIEGALTGRFEDWRAEVKSALALVLLLDQFTRNAFRDTARAFAGDREALATALMIVDAGLDRGLDFHERSFVYLPFEHSEDPVMQGRSVALSGQLSDESGSPGYREWAEKHAEVIRRFGRFPHRNLILGRTSTPEEIAFLEQPGSRF